MNFCLGRGWLTIVFTKAHDAYLTESGNVCVPTPFLGYPPESPCGLYVKLSFDGKTVYQTRVIEIEEAHFFEIFSSKRISKNMEVKLELRDHNAGSIDDLLLQRTGTINDILGFQSIKNNGDLFEFVATWRHEYED